MKTNYYLLLFVLFSSLFSSLAFAFILWSNEVIINTTQYKEIIIKVFSFIGFIFNTYVFIQTFGYIWKNEIK
jgi:hypothetical protein